jgi:hypothetical protein
MSKVESHRSKQDIPASEINSGCGLYEKISFLVQDEFVVFTVSKSSQFKFLNLTIYNRVLGLSNDRKC